MASEKILEEIAKLDVATVHEAMGKRVP